MLKSENIFKFVSIRAPEEKESSATTPTPSTDATPSRVPIPPIRLSDPDFINRMFASVSDEVSLEEARSNFAREFMDSSSYVIRSPAWRPFVVVGNDVDALIRHAESEQVFRTEFEQILKNHLDADVNDLDGFINSDLFHDLKRSLWHSYFCNVSLVTYRPHDRIKLELWIKVWHLLELLVGGQSFAMLQQHFPLWQILVPNQLVLKEKQTFESTFVGNEEANLSLSNNKKIAAYKTKISKLQATRAHLTQVFENKLVTSMAAVPQDTLLKNKNTIVNVMPSSESAHINLKLKADEINKDAEKLLKDLDISLSTMDVTEINALLERQEAEIESEIFDLIHEKTIKFVRGVPVRISRKDPTHAPTQD